MFTGADHAESSSGKLSFSHPFFPPAWRTEAHGNGYDRNGNTHSSGFGVSQAQEKNPDDSEAAQSCHVVVGDGRVCFARPPLSVWRRLRRRPATTTRTRTSTMRNAYIKYDIISTTMAKHTLRLGCELSGPECYEMEAAWLIVAIFVGPGNF